MKEVKANFSAKRRQSLYMKIDMNNSKMFLM